MRAYVINYYNRTIIDINVLPSGDRSNFNLNFTWETTKFFDDELIIQLKFDDPSSISPNKEQDELVFFLMDNYKDYFMSAPLYIPVDESYRLMKIKIMP